MSVINKMLSDLDRRAEAPGGAAVQPAAPTSVTRGTASVTTLPFGAVRHARRPGWMLWAAIVLAGLLLAAIGWFGAMGRVTRAAEPRLPGALAPAPPSAAAPSMPHVVPADVVANVPVPSPAPVSVTANTAQVTAPTQPAQPVAKPAGENAVAAGTAQPGPPLPGLAKLPATPMASAALPLTPPSSMQATPQPAQAPVALAPMQAAPVPWQDAALETVGQAQRLWAAGTRDAALELLREALQVLERSHGAELASTGSAATLALVRELARMELAQGQPAAVLALLQRHQHLLAGRADLWAVRANAAQRIGQHNEASLAYHTALRIRPGEPRWMLGAAVSLAALGQVAAAAELAEQARAIEAVSPELLAYLRQLGVPLRDR